MELDIAARARTFGGCATSTGAASSCKRSQRKSAERSKEWSSFLLDTNGPNLRVSAKSELAKD